MTVEEPTWIVMARDVSGTVTVTGQPRVVVALILDADTGLVRGISVGETVRARGSAVTPAPVCRRCQDRSPWHRCEPPGSG
jgi:hypothetical protein